MKQAATPRQTTAPDCVSGSGLRRAEELDRPSGHITAGHSVRVGRPGMGLGCYLTVAPSGVNQLPVGVFLICVQL